MLSRVLVSKLGTDKFALIIPCIQVSFHAQHSTDEDIGRAVVYEHTLAHTVAGQGV
jgi:hypothetical protein